MYRTLLPCILTLLGLSTVGAYELTFKLSVDATLTPEERAAIVLSLSRQFASSTESSSPPTVVVSGSPTNIQQPSPPPPWLPGGARFHAPLTNYGMVARFKVLPVNAGEVFPVHVYANTATSEFSHKLHTWSFQILYDKSKLSLPVSASDRVDLLTPSSTETWNEPTVTVNEDYDVSEGIASITVTSTNSNMQTSEGSDVPIARVNFLVESSLTAERHDDAFEGKVLSMVGTGSNEFAADVNMQVDDWRGGAQISASFVVTTDTAPSPVSSSTVTINSVSDALPSQCFYLPDTGMTMEQEGSLTTTADGVFVNHIFGGKTVSASVGDIVYIRACASPTVDTPITYNFVVLSSTYSFTVQTMAQAPYPPPLPPSPPSLPPLFPSPPPRPPPPTPLSANINLGAPQSVAQGGCVQITFKPYTDYDITTQGVNYDVTMTGRSSWPGETFIIDEGFLASSEKSGFWNPEVFSSSSFYKGTTYTFLNAESVTIGAQFCAGISPTNVDQERYYEFQITFTEFGTSTTYQSTWLRLNLPYLAAPSSAQS